MQSLEDQIAWHLKEATLTPSYDAMRWHREQASRIQEQLQNSYNQTPSD